MGQPRQRGVVEVGVGSGRGCVLGGRSVLFSRRGAAAEVLVIEMVVVPGQGGAQLGPEAALAAGLVGPEEDALAAEALAQPHVAGAVGVGAQDY